MGWAKSLYGQYKGGTPSAGARTLSVPSMAIGATMRIDGAAELAAALQRLPNRVRARVIRVAISAGASPILAAVKATVPQDSGTLKRSIMAAYRTYGRGATQMVLIGARLQEVTVARTKRGRLRGVTTTGMAAARARGAVIQRYNPAMYLHLVERGRGWVRPKKRTVLRTRDGRFIGREVQPVVGARVVETAFDVNRGTAQQRMVSKLREGIAKEATKLAGRTR